MPEQCSSDIIESLGNLPLIMFVDFELRTGNENFDVVHTVSCCFDIFGNNEDKHRASFRVLNDNVVFAKYLVNVCTIFDLTYVNGSQDGDDIGNYAHVSPTAVFIVSRNLLFLSFLFCFFEWWSNN